jgi:hypothetical protein
LNKIFRTKNLVFYSDNILDFLPLVCLTTGSFVVLRNLLSQGGIRDPR